MTFSKTGFIFRLGIITLLSLLFASNSIAAERLVYETFDDQRWDDSFNRTFNPSNVSIVSSASAHSGNYVARMYGGYLGAAFDYNINITNNSSIYITYYQYFPGSWSWNSLPESGIKQLRAQPGDGWPLMMFKIGPRTHCYFSQGNHPSALRTWNPIDSYPALDRWLKVEILIRYSDTNGGYYWKIDDRLIAGSETFAYDTWPPAAGEINNIRIAGGNGFPDGDFYYIDDIEIWDDLPDGGGGGGGGGGTTPPVTPTGMDVNLPN